MNIRKIVLITFTAILVVGASKNLSVEKYFNITKMKDVSSTLGAAAGDIDNDGDLDLVTANMFSDSGAGHTKILFNDGKGNFSYSKQELLNNTHGVALADLDKDGDLDLIISRNSNEAKATKVFLNNGKGQFSDSGQSFGTEAGLSVQAADLDCDGDLDLYCDYYESENMIFLNDGKAKFTRYKGRFSAELNFGLLTDLNNDGKVDWFIKIPGKGYRIEHNKGDMKFEIVQEINDPEADWGGVFAADINNDGYNDIINKNSFKQAELFINNSLGEIYSKQKFGFKSRGARFAAGDLNNDGFKDIFIANNFMPDQIFFTENGKVKNDAVIFGEKELSMFSIIADFNNDGGNDLFISRGIKIVNKKRVFLKNLLLMNNMKMTD